MLEFASRLSSPFSIAVLVFLLFPVLAPAQLIQPDVILPDPNFTSYFGTGLALSGDTLAVGAPSDGAVWIHERNRGGKDHWGLVGAVNNHFYLDGTGEDVALSGDFLVAGKPAQLSYPSDKGAARIFERNRGGADFWGIVLTLTPSDPADARLFGTSVAISGDTVAVGSVGNASVAGSVYIFERNRGGADHWGEVRKVTLPGIAGSAVSVALRGDTLLVGASEDDGRGVDAGAVYVFGRNQGGAEQWGQVQKLTASNAAAGHRFGTSVEISGDTMVVGAPGARAAYVFEGGQGAWSEARKLSISDGNAVFGQTVTIDGDVIVVGAPTASFSDRNSAYVFRRNLGGPGQWVGAGRLAARDSLLPLAVGGNVAVIGNPEWGELFGAEVYIFDLTPLLAQDIPALGPFGLAALALLLLSAGWWISASRRRGSRPGGIDPGGRGPR